MPLWLCCAHPDRQRNNSPFRQAFSVREPAPPHLERLPLYPVSFSEAQAECQSLPYVPGTVPHQMHVHPCIHHTWYGISLLISAVLPPAAMSAFFHPEFLIQ